MVKFLCTLSANPDVEDAMRDINNYIMYKDESVVNDSLRVKNIENEFESYYQCVQNINLNYTLNPYYEIVSQGKLSKVKRFVKRVVRKCISWYMKELCRQQEEINANIIRALNQQLIMTQMLIDENKSLRNQIDILKKAEDDKGDL